MSSQHEDAANAAGTATIGSIEYRPMDRSRNEIRLLKILPSIYPPGKAKSLEFNKDIIRVELQYHSFDDLIKSKGSESPPEHSPNPTPSSSDPSDNAIETGLQNLSLKKENTPENDSGGIVPKGETISVKRVELLGRIFMPQYQYYQKLVPPCGWHPGDPNEDLFSEWVQSWIWTRLPRNIEDKVEGELPGYIALSYVWSRVPEVSDHAARQAKLYSTLSNLSPSCAKLFEEAYPAVLEIPDEAKDVSHIIVDGVRVEVGRNLESALRALREIPDVQSGLLVWADALCINQNDIAERNIEVKRMNQIYSHATRVASYIGDLEESQVDAVESLCFLGHSFSVLERIHKDLPTAHLNKFNLGNLVDLQANLAGIPYFERIWIVQEIALAASGSFVICNNRRFDLSFILKFVYIFNIRRGIFPSNAEILWEYAEYAPRVGQNFLDFNTQLICLHDAYGFRKQPPGKNQGTLTEQFFGSLFLRLASACQCKDPRDRVYGMMSIFPDEVSAAIVPEYAETKTTAQVMADLSMSLIRDTSKLDWMLLANDISPIIDEWLSWVPNLALPYKDITLKWVIGHQPQGNRTEAEVSWGPEKSYGVDVLRCKGIKLDTIASCGKPSTNYDLEEISRQMQVDPETFPDIMVKIVKIYTEPLLLTKELASVVWLLKDILTSHLEAAKSPPKQAIPHEGSHKYGDDQGLREAIEHCIKTIGWTPNTSRFGAASIFSIPRQVEKRAAEGDQSCKDLLSLIDPDFIDFKKRQEKLDFWGHDLESFFDENPTIRQSYGQQLLELMREFHRGTRGNLFTTVGGYVGATVCRLQPGDEVYILFGGKMPVVLRKVDDGYRLVASVYIHGVMKGEAMEEFEQSGEPAVEVVIV